jgi:hypothetical protein
MTKIIKFRTKDKNNYEFEYKHFINSNLIKIVYDNDNELEDIIELSNIRGDILEIVNYMLIRFFKLGNDIDNFKHDEEIYNFLENLDYIILFSLLSGVHYMDIPILENILCDKLSGIISSKSKDELEKMFNIKLKIK